MRRASECTVTQSMFIRWRARPRSPDAASSLQLSAPLVLDYNGCSASPVHHRYQQGLQGPGHKVGGSLSFMIKIPDSLALFQDSEWKIYIRTTSYWHQSEFRLKSNQRSWCQYDIFFYTYRASLGNTEVFLTIPSNTSNMLGLKMTYLNDLYKLLEYEIQILLCFWRWTHVWTGGGLISVFISYWEQEILLFIEF